MTSLNPNDYLLLNSLLLPPVSNSTSISSVIRCVVSIERFFISANENLSFSPYSIQLIVYIFLQIIYQPVLFLNCQRWSEFLSKSENLVLLMRQSHVHLILYYIRFSALVKADLVSSNFLEVADNINYRKKKSFRTLIVFNRNFKYFTCQFIPQISEGNFRFGQNP